MKKIVIVGGGFAGMACAEELIRHPNIHVTLIDKNNYHEFTPLLYQVATSSLGIEAAASSFRYNFSGKPNIDIKMGHVIEIDPKSLAVTTEEGQSYSGDYLVLSAGSAVNFFNTSGAKENCLPLYTLIDAEKLRSRILLAFEKADRNPKQIEKGILNFVIVGAGPTGTEVAGALADMLKLALPKEFSDIALNKARIYLVNHGPAVLDEFSKDSQTYAAKVLQNRGVELLMGTSVDQITDSFALLSNGNKILSQTVIWAGGVKASDLANHTSLPQGQAGRIIVRPDLTVEGFPTLYALGDFAVLPGNLPQLASVAKQTGQWAAKNILSHIEGKPLFPFQYNDKGIMAMIGKKAAVVEIGEKRHELKGFFAYLAWLGVHMTLLSSFSQKFQAFTDWLTDYFSKTPAFQILDDKETK